mmetsp:Transcript_117059/g.303574  ORF Transcript_117059/g.303574 Transcript_117059/m.303574 type:complete len:240 (-) Transcript_117059:1398-2117(-)
MAAHRGRNELLPLLVEEANAHVGDVEKLRAEHLSSGFEFSEVVGAIHLGGERQAIPSSAPYGFHTFYPSAHIQDPGSGVTQQLQACDLGRRQGQASAHVSNHSRATHRTLRSACWCDGRDLQRSEDWSAGPRLERQGHHGCRSHDWQRCQVCKSWCLRPNPITPECMHRDLALQVKDGGFHQLITDDTSTITGDDLGHDAAEPRVRHIERQPQGPALLAQPSSAGEKAPKNPTRFQLVP